MNPNARGPGTFRHGAQNYPADDGVAPLNALSMAPLQALLPSQDHLSFVRPAHLLSQDGRCPRRSTTPVRSVSITLLNGHTTRFIWRVKT